MTHEEEQLLRVWGLFKQIKFEAEDSYPELNLFDDQSGSVLDFADRHLLEWDSFEEAIAKLEQYLSQQ